MKEIHQALISLGPLVSSCIFSLKQKEQECQVFTDRPDSQKEDREGNVFSMQAVSCRVKEEGYQLFVDHQGSKRDKAISAVLGEVIGTQSALCQIKEEQQSFPVDSRASEPEHNVSSSAGEVIGTQSSLCQIKEEQQSFPVDSHASEPEQNVSSSVGKGVFAPVSHVIKREKDVFLVDPQNYNIKEVSCNPSVETVVAVTLPQMNVYEEGGNFQKEQPSNGNNTYPVVTGVYSLGCNSEEVTRVKKEREPECRITAGNVSMNRRKKVRDPLRGSERTTPRRWFTTDLSTTVAAALLTCNKEADSQRQMWSECYPEFGRDQTTHNDSGVGNPVHFSCAQEGLVVGRSYDYNEFENILKNPHIAKELPGVHSSQRTYKHTESDKSHSLKAKISTHKKVVSRERPFACTECGKRFFKKSHLITHRRRQYGEKTHGCIFCHKRFNQKVHLEAHIKIHTGARPYTCTECEESFVRRQDLNQHRTKHIQTSKTTK
ncbi:uncharacterized protein [Pleurodeles waltl]|uniref:uncharacterized protein isoform X1 n=1 Tax=Pleurodeles waltl TaxID=8319 RepID=UPI00370981DC